jgi:aminopeptidase N
MFRTVLGTDEYRKSQTAFLREYATKSANTQEWEASVERTTGQDLHWFVDEWLYKAGFPEYHVSYAYDEAAHVIHLTVDQTQSTAWDTPAVFTMPIAIETQTADGTSTTTTIQDDARSKTFDIPCASAPAMVLFDPGHNVLSKVTFEKSDGEFDYQMRHASSVLDRLDAVQALLAHRSPSAAELAPATWFLRHEPYAEARASIVDSFDALAPSKSARQALTSALSDPSAHVRFAAANALGDFSADPAAIASLKRLAASDPSYNTVAASLVSLAKVDASGISPILARALVQPSNNGVIASAALHGFAIVEKSGAIALEERYAKYGAPQTSRNAAIAALGTIGKTDAQVTTFLTSLLGDPNFRTNFALFRALGGRADPKAIPALERFAKMTEDVRLRQGAQAAVATIEAMTRRPTKRP